MRRVTQDEARDPYASPHRTVGEERARAAAARLKVTIDSRRGRETPAWIRALAEKFPRP